MVNLHAIAGPVVGSVNPQFPVSVQISIGPSTELPDGTRMPGFATPGAFTGAISGTDLTVSAVSTGVLQVGQTVAGSGVVPGTMITEDAGGNGGPGAYKVNQPQTLASRAMTTTLTLLAQIQPMTWRDIQQFDGLNLQGTRQKIYLSGEIDGLVRVEKKGGDLITIPPGHRHAGIWLVAQVLAQWPDFVEAAIVLQDGT